MNQLRGSERVSECYCLCANGSTVFDSSMEVV